MPFVAAIPAIGLLAGCALGLIAVDSPPVIKYGEQLASAALIVAALVALCAWRRAIPWLLVAAVVVTFGAGGMLLSADAWQHAWRPTLRIDFDSLARQARADAREEGRRLPEDTSVSLTLTGVLRSDASPTPAGASLSLDVATIDTPSPHAANGGLSLTVVGELASARIDDWRAGRTVRTTAQLRRPSRYLDPGVPDEERLLARRGTTLVGTIKSGALVDVIARGNVAAESAAGVRAFVRRSVASAVGRWSPQAAAIVTAIVIGDRTGLEDDVQRRLQEAGTYHVIAISGGNIAILAGLTLGLFRITGLLGRTARPAMLGAIAALVAYGYLVGGGASVDRATLMAVVYFAGRALDLRGPPLNTLALVAGLLVAADPLTIADPAFLLTFGATAAILVVVPSMRLARLPRAIVPIAAMFAASAATEVALLPVSAFVFSRITFAGLLLNFAAIPLMAVAQIAGMALVPVALVSSRLASAIGWVAFVGAAGLVWSADLVRLAPVVTWRVAAPGWLSIAAYYAGAIAAWTLARRQRRLLGSRETAVVRFARLAATGCAIVAAIWIVGEPWRLASTRGDGRLHVTFIDVGQGDAALVQFPRGGALMVDAGGLSATSSFDVGDRVVAPVLRNAGVGRLQAVALTHGDADHIGGASSVMREFRPGEVWEGIPVPSFGPLDVLKVVANQIDARWTNVQAADRMMVEDVAIVVRHPGIADWERRVVRNNDSVVLELEYRDVSIVLTGDIEKETEQAIAPLFSPSRLRVVKVPHHGSQTSSTSTFVRALAPRVAIVSVGRSNTFGQPSPSVIERYRSAGAEVFRTDQDGAIMLDTDGRSVNIHTVTGRVFSIPKT